MSTLRKIGAATAAVLFAAGIGLTAAVPADASTSDGVEARTVLPYVGHYMGRDGHHRLIQFYFNGHQIQHFKINGHERLSGAPVQGHQAHHFCQHNSMCIRGHWSWDTSFTGFWNDPRQGHSVAFTADLYSH